MDVLLRAQSLSKAFGHTVLFDSASFDIYETDCIGIIGPNGCGKTTLLKILLGWVSPNDGEIWKKEHIHLRYLDQSAMQPTDKTIQDFFNRTTKPDTINKEIQTYEKELEDPTIYEDTQRVEELLEKIQKLSVSANKNASINRWEQAQQLFTDIKLKHISLETKTKTLSGGEKQKIALASVFAQPKECDLLLLDEPTNHLDIETMEWLEQQILDFPSAVMMISHDRYLLDDLVDRVFELRGTHIDVFDARFSEFEELRKLKDHIKTQEYVKSQVMIRRQQKVIDTMTRRNRYDKQIRSKIKQLEKMKKVENSVIKEYLLKFQFKSKTQYGKNVVDGKAISKSFGDTSILNEVDFEVLSGQKIGVIGANGCGKTTFLKMIIGTIAPDEGEMHMSSGVRFGYFDQGHLSLKPGNTLLEEMQRDQQELSETDAKGLLGQFNFKEDMVFHKVQMLSGGERARLSLLRLLIQSYNFLILDEPTNHMDMESKAAIESAINAYPGTVMVVSHDRRFLDMIADTIFFMDKGKIYTYKGNYTSFRVQHQKKLVHLSDRNLAHLSSSGLEKYVATKAFTCWSTKTKHAKGEYVYIGDHNEAHYDWAIEGGFLRKIETKKKRRR